MKLITIIRQKHYGRSSPVSPPALLPVGNLANYQILWEAEWETVPVDPMLLKHLGKSLYVVLAQWDLTPLEQGILRDAE
ncbi:MAG: hypothetical protein ACIAZJ_26335 [Gimesia chilikensis]|uniref:hypothetical protein n=1 Tax=Gimesia chilikensis TaxID=2605989 RepID=UPI0037AD8DE4